MHARWRPPSLRRRLLRAAGAAGLLGVAFGGCSMPGYVARLGWMQARILLDREPIARLLARPGLDPELRERLALVLAVREFARERLGLAVGDSYASYVAVDGAARLWVLTAAHRDRLEPHTWWFPVAGRVPYRGFVDRAAADAAGEALRRRGLDVDVRGAAAFSTLGWFADPLFSTMTAGPPEALAETVIHELFHATLYVPGASAFNESAATFVGHRGAIAFFCEGPGADAARCRTARRRWAVTRARGRVLQRLAARLRRLYAACPDPARRERARRALAAAAGASLERRGIGQRAELLPPNNARLLGRLIYTTDLDAFERLAPGDADLSPALLRLADAVRGARDPFAAVKGLATRREGR